MFFRQLKSILFISAILSSNLVFAQPTSRGASGLRRLAEQCGKDFQGGVLLHAGTSTLPLEIPGGMAVPLARMWDM